MILENWMPVGFFENNGMDLELSIVIMEMYQNKMKETFVWILGYSHDGLRRIFTMLLI